MFYKPRHVLETVKAMSWRARAGILTATVLLLSGGGLAASAAVDAAASIPTQQVRTGPDVANWCIKYGTNTLVYDYNQVQCPTGTYPLSFVSASQSYTLDINGTTENCTFAGTAASGNESDAVNCTGPSLGGGTGGGPTPSAGSNVLTVPLKFALTFDGQTQNCNFTQDATTGAYSMSCPGQISSGSSATFSSAVSSAQTFTVTTSGFPSGVTPTITMTGNGVTSNVLSLAGGGTVTLTAGANGTATLTTSAPLTTADDGTYPVTITAVGGGITTPQAFTITVAA